MSEIAISVKDLSKRFRIGAKVNGSDTFLQTVTNALKSPFVQYRKLRELTRFDEESETVFWALRDIDFEVKKGEVMGVIGHNGAGKSTLLKILSRITEPTSGEARLNGRVSSLLEVGTGFHPELTGRENVYMNGTILGMTKREINSKFDEIVSFSGIEKHLDTPVKFYSSGMKVRLGFAVAAHLEPEILIIDEVLAVGDIGFQRKCLGKMNEVARGGRAVIFVSHNMAAVENLCTTGLLLDHGKAVFLGPVKDTVKQYISHFRTMSSDGFLSNGAPRSGNGKARIVAYTVKDLKKNCVEMVKTGDGLRLCFNVHAREPVANVDVGFSLHTEDNDQLLFILYSSYTGRLFDVAAGENELECLIESMPLPEGKFLVKAQLMANGEVLDFPQAGVGFIDVVEGDYYGTGQKSSRLTKERPLFLVKGNWNKVDA